MGLDRWLPLQLRLSGLMSLWLCRTSCWLMFVPFICGSTDNHLSLNLPAMQVLLFLCQADRPIDAKCNNSARSRGSARVSWREWYMAPRYAWPADLIDGWNLSHDVHFCRYTWSHLFKSSSCVPDFFLPLHIGLFFLERQLLRKVLATRSMPMPATEASTRPTPWIPRPVTKSAGSSERSGALGDFSKNCPKWLFFFVNLRLRLMLVLGVFALLCTHSRCVKWFCRSRPALHVCGLLTVSPLLLRCFGRKLNVERDTF